MPDPTTVTRFGIALPPATEDATRAYVSTVLDPQIDELQNQLALLQGVRRAIAGTFGIDRREDVGAFGQMADRSKRAEYEGEGTDVSDRLVVRRKAAS